ncbi:Stress responsive A/B Barrel Domain [Actinacidiphila alni]|uniref:Stress responsive A/B Barrel Domain n=1 Tax=Actinacidiphila alni TaxID=380248 RepID=A0A1I2LTJ4_9ACTN|nr:Dabb family protein [Actinacidiphila alni]SFF81720.1 Stress responsive A/B Barrel Domain [Actinacidiphila alni]
MIRNIVFFKLNDGVTAENPDVAAGVELVEALEKEIPEIRQWEFGGHALDRMPISYDFALNSLFEDVDAFLRFMHHPAHQAVIAHWQTFSSWVVVDMDV